MKNNDRIMIRCCDAEDEEKLLKAAAGMGISVDDRIRGDQDIIKGQALSTAVYIFDPERNVLTFTGQRSIYAAMQSCDERSFSAEEFLNIRRSGAGFRESAVPVFHIPHDGWKFPEELMKSVCLSREEFMAYHEKMRDSYTALLVPPCYRTLAQSVEFEVSRLLCDVERFDGPEEMMERYGMGICYEKAFDGVGIKDVTEELKKNTAVYYREHHRRMNMICRENRRILLFDLHSFSEDIIPADLLESGRETPDLCIGTDPACTPAWLTETVRIRFEEAGFSTAVNYPYRGCYVPESIFTGESSCDLMPVMLEFNKRTYMRPDGFLDDTKVLEIRKVIRDIAAECSVRKRRIIRTIPRSFDTDWKKDLRSVGIVVPEKIRISRYAPVSHDPMPFSLEIDLDTRTLCRQIIGVIPNAMYKGHICQWEELCRLMDQKAEAE